MDIVQSCLLKLSYHANSLTKETLNTLLDKEADELHNAEKYE